MLSFRWLVSLSVAGVAAGCFVLGSSREPFVDHRWEIEAVTVMDPNPTTYRLEQPFRVLRRGQVTFSHHEDPARLPVVRLDMNIDGEHVVVFARRQE
jgi:hypothetical protein